ncbi:MAG TPA: nucleoside deaminase [Prevotella sp.]
MDINSEQQKKDEQFMQKALVEAKAAYAADEIPVGAVVVCGNRIVSRAHNLTETLHDVTAHAEMQAITAAADALGGKYLQDCTLYVTVEPCTMCAGAIGWAQIKRIVYGAADEKRGFHKYAPQALHPKATVTAGVLEEDCRALMQEFFRERR